MKTIFIFLVLFGLSFFSIAQQFEQAFFESEAKNGVQEFFHKSSKASFGGFTYVAGSSVNGNGNYDMLLTKYSAVFKNDGQLMWSTMYGNGDYNWCNAVVANATKMWIVGTTNGNWTQKQFDLLSLNDYFVTIPNNQVESQEATIARFDLSSVLSDPNRNDEIVTSQFEDINVWPSPTDGRINFFTSTFQEGEMINVTVFDGNGRGVIIDRCALRNSNQIDVSNLPSGIYFLRIDNGVQYKNVKFHVVH